MLLGKECDDCYLICKISDNLREDRGRKQENQLRPLAAVAVLLLFIETEKESKVHFHCGGSCMHREFGKNKV
jgi:hypothetical protein